MSGWMPRFGPPDPRRFAAPRKRWLILRVAIYGAVVASLLVFRVIPGVRGRTTDTALFTPVDTTLAISGVSLAPGLVDHLAREYCSEYPQVKAELRTGGTTHGLEDLLNDRSEVAFLSRLPTESEAEVIRAQGDSVNAFPVALGAIAVLASSRSGRSSMSLDDLARALGKGTPLLGDPERVYVPEPNLGLWGAVAEKLGLADVPPVNVRWAAGEAEVVSAVAGDDRSIGFASTLALPADFQESGVEFVALGEGGSSATFPPLHEPLISGDYPLFHYLYVSCRAGSGAQAAAFVTYVFSGRGQRLVDRAGFLPARNVPHLVQLVSRPIGSPGT